ncbi:MAG: NADH-quinone oxidoreductase subunit H [Candidatus Omnitrophica bacterium]|nr:NADH-quinone oxidoreductase subunit H [Candidatus Omnitrophota bacterium]
MKGLFSYLIFPGFLFSAFIGLIAGWLDRKITARIQWRKGPPWYQNFLDILKLLGKETIIPEGTSALTFIFSPFFGFLSAVLATTILGRSIIFPREGFLGDLIVVLYLLMIPVISIIIGASASHNPLASLGASREMKMALGYELFFLFCVSVVIIKTNGAIQLGSIINHQMSFKSNIFSFSGFLAFLLLVLFYLPAKLGFVPFDAPEAEQEIIAGTMIEYSGLGLAIFKLTKAILLYTMPVLLIVLFLGKDLSALFLILKYLAILLTVIIIKNTNPRLRIDQVLRLFWGPVGILAFLAVILAGLGY